MKELIIIPNKSIGAIKLGMEREQVEKLFDYKCEEEEQIGELLSVRYNRSRIIILYENNKVVEITLDSSISEEYNVILEEINLFTTKVEDIIKYLRNYSEYSYNSDDELLSTEYIFKDLGIVFWRESAFHPKLLDEDWFLEMSDENQEYEKKFWYFNTLTLGSIKN